MKKSDKDSIESQISNHVKALYPGCFAEFCGQQGKAKKVSRTFGFRVKHSVTGKYHSNIVWVDPEYKGEINSAWVQAACK